MGMLETLTGLPITVKDKVLFLDVRQNVILIKCIHAQVVRYACLYQGVTLHFNVLLDPLGDTLKLYSQNFFIMSLLDVLT
jgi:hypothetical protein